MIAPNPSISTPNNPRNSPEQLAQQSRSVLARLRQRQLELARDGRITESMEYADRARRILDHLTRH